MARFGPRLLRARYHRPMKSLFVVLGNHLFPPDALGAHCICETHVFMAEDMELCTYVRHHQQKIVLFLAAMREYADELRSSGMTVTYHELSDAFDSYEDRLAAHLATHPAAELVSFEVEDHFFATRLDAFAADHGLARRVVESPMFVTPRAVFDDYLDGVKKPFMARFYEQQRQRLDVLVESDGSPVGGKWSFDADNRRKLPRGHTPPDVAEAPKTKHTREVIDLVHSTFSNHPGDAREFWLPVTRRQSLDWLETFFDERFAAFGDYEDAISIEHPFIYHAMISPMMNIGLLTPREIIDRATDFARDHDIPMNSVEGFVRQIIGWREFVRGIYHHFDEEQSSSNFWEHTREPTRAWWDGTTGLPPLDRAIRTATRWAWTHHIQRLMVVANVMNLCELNPTTCHRWFMEMYADSSDWVMGPNVYGMGLFSDGGIFSTKPYLCGSNYILKMSNEPKGDWCEVMDGLYWRFIDRHREFFESNPRLSMMPRMLAKLDPDRKKRIFSRAADFIDEVTTTTKTR